MGCSATLLYKRKHIHLYKKNTCILHFLWYMICFYRKFLKLRHSDMFGCSTEPILHSWTVACTLPVTYLVEVLDTRHCFLHQATKIDDVASCCLNFNHSNHSLMHQTSINNPLHQLPGKAESNTFTCSLQEATSPPRKIIQSCNQICHRCSLK